MHDGNNDANKALMLLPRPLLARLPPHPRDRRPLPAQAPTAVALPPVRKHAPATVALPLARKPRLGALPARWPLPLLCSRHINKVCKTPCALLDNLYIRLISNEAVLAYVLCLKPKLQLGLSPA